jgi:leucyl aminopeptidase (aminopeptidase T)
VNKALADAQATTVAERNQGKTRTLYVGISNPSDTASIQMEYGPYNSMSLAAIGADYGAIAAKGQEIKRVLRGARRLRITSPEGTDFTVELSKRPVVVSAGSVPSGTRGTVAARTSAVPGNGAVRSDREQC